MLSLRPIFRVILRYFSETESSYLRLICEKGCGGLNDKLGGVLGSGRSFFWSACTGKLYSSRRDFNRCTLKFCLSARVPSQVTFGVG